MINVRAPTQRSSPVQYPHLHILLRHPGYDNDSNVLLRLRASDDNADGQLGLYAQFAIDACVIVTGNCNGQGWLSLSRDGNAPINPTGILHERSYYFHLNDAKDPYPVISNFRQWAFPHDRLPLHWQELCSGTNCTSISTSIASSDLTTALLVRDGACRLSGCCEGVQVAHLVPDAELDWWKANNISRYNAGMGATLEDTANALLLRADLHIAFDTPRIALVPKPATDGSMRLVAHVLEYSPELRDLYHNRELHPTPVAVEMLYARFAWTVFKNLGSFLEGGGVHRRLTLRGPDAGPTDTRDCFTADGCELLSSAAIRKRSRSPEKRKQECDAVVEVDNTPKAVDAEIEADSPDIISSKRARQRSPSAYASNSQDATLGLSPTPTHLATDTALSLRDREPSSAADTELLAQSWLEAERERSDPNGTWNEEQEWICQVWAGKTLASSDLSRWLKGAGYDTREE